MQRFQRDPALVAFGAVLALTHTLTAASWTGNRELTRLLAPGRPAICWPFLPGCEAVRVVPELVWSGLPWLVALGGVVVALLFAARRTKAAMGGLAVLTALGLAVLLQDYRLRLNQHLMHNLVLLAFLGLPDRRRTLQVLVVSFYFWAGTIKLNADWLTGAALLPTGVPGIPDAWLPLACAYVVFLELFGVFGLFGPRWLRWLTLGQLGLFHLLSYGVVGFYYPLLTVGLLSIFPLCWTLAAPERTEPSRPWIPAFVALGFAALQLLPRLAPGDPALTGRGHLLSLHMFDAKVVCEGHLLVTTTDGQVQRVPLPTDQGPDRMRCDPVIHRGIARHTCSRPDVRDLDLRLSSRRSTSTELVPVLTEDRFCSTAL